ncbi:hypothetical protein BJX96DRAFT_144213 [Aspergillus floccosus]
MSDQKRGTDQDPSKPPRNPPTTTNPPSQPQPPSQSQQQQQQPPPSLASRIQSSAAGLARNAFSSGSSADAHLLSGSSTSSGKPSSSAASTAALSAAHQYTQETSSPSSAASHARTAHPAETFRSAQGQYTQHTPGGFELPPLTADEFAHAPIDISDTNLPLATKGKGKQPATQSASPSSATVPTLLESDGDAVVSLLTSPTFSPEFPNEASAEPFEPVETDLSETLSPAELQMIQSFRRQLHQTDPSYDEQGQRQTHLTSLSLVPDIDTILSSAPSSTLADATALRDAVLTGLPGAADWVAVEERYHDEVWGYLRPALEAAKKEMEEDKARGSEEGPAVRRLKMILKHMQG